MRHYICSNSNNSYPSVSGNEYNNPASTISDYSNGTEFCGCGCNDNIGSEYTPVDLNKYLYSSKSQNSNCSCCPMFWVIIALLLIIYFNR